MLAGTTAPLISAVSSSAVSSSAATVNWTTDGQSDSQVEYGTTAAYGLTTTLNAALVTAHSQGLSGLAPGTAYHFRVKSCDAAGNLATSDDFSFTTGAALDTTPPVIGAVSSSSVSSASATVSWTTNEESDGQVEYGATAAYGSATALNGVPATAHSQGLTGLVAGATYHFRVNSRDAAGNLAASGDFSF
ncbi:MAG: hypothetical protein DMG07_27670, partial [Acidobacteria bacterium]